jgi:hypothetical protein
MSRTLETTPSRPNTAGVLEHRRAVDLETFAELDGGVGDQLFQMHLALDQRQFPEVVTVEIEQVECHQHDLSGAAL